MSVGLVEAIWILINSITVVLTVAALLDAWHDLRVAAGADRRRARVLTARGNVRREALRLTAQGLLFSIVIPELFSDREVGLSPVVVVLIAVAVTLMVASLFDAIDRNRLANMLLTDIATERASLALEASVQENIELTREAVGRADAAYKEANTVNEKIATLTELVSHKEDKPAGEA